MKKGQVLKIDDAGVHFKTINFDGGECFFTSAILGLQNHSEEAARARKNKHLPKELSGIFDVYIETIVNSPMYDVGYIVREPETGKYLYLPTSVVFFMLEDSSAREKADFEIYYTFKGSAFLKFNNERYWFAGTVIGKDLPDGYTRDDSAVYAGMPLSEEEITSLEAGDPCDRIHVIDDVVNTYKAAIDNFKHYVVMLEFLRKEMAGEDTREEISSIVTDMLKDKEGREMLLDLIAEMAASINE